MSALEPGISYGVVNEPPNPEPLPDNLSDPRLTQARLHVQTIQRFQMLHNRIWRISDLQERETAQQKLDALGAKEFGKAWEVLKQFEVEVFSMMIGGKTKDELKQELAAGGFQVHGYAEQMMDNPDFVTLAQPEPIVLCRLLVRDILGISGLTTTSKLYAKVKEIGLDLCPAEVGPWYRLHIPNQPSGTNVSVGMSPIADINGESNVFRVVDSTAVSWLHHHFARPGEQWHAKQQFLFRLPLRNSEQTETSHD